MEETQTDFKYFLEELNYRIDKSYNSRNRIKLILRLYILIGFLTFVISALYFLITYFPLQLSDRQQTVILIGSVGLLIAIIGKFTMEYLKERDRQNEARRIELEKLSNFIIAWGTLEKTISRYLEFKNMVSNPFGISKNLDLLYKEGVISNREFIMLERALDLRNGIVHGKLSVPSDIDKYNNALMKIVDKIMEKSKI